MQSDSGYSGDLFRRLCGRAGQAGIGILLAGLGGCAANDPWTMAGHWQSTGVNEANLAAQVENPADLVQGRSVPGADGQRAAAAVARLRAGTVKPLPDVGLAQIKLNGNAGGPELPSVAGLGGY